MKIKSLLFAATAVVIGLSACSKEDGGKVGTGEKSMFIKFEQAKLTRADVGDNVDGTDPQFNDGHLYFTTSTGVVKRYIRVTSTSTAGTISPQTLQNGTIIEQLSEDITRVYLYGNAYSGQEMNIANISEMNTKVVTLAQQRDAAYGVKNAILTGAGFIEEAPASATHNADYEAIFEIKPMVARIEIEKLTAHAVKGPRAYTLDGIYMNNYHLDFSLGNVAVGGATNNGQDWTKYHAGAGSYAVTDRGYLFDDQKPNGDKPLGAGTNSYRTVQPVNKYWAYNFFATGEPHVVLCLKDVTLSDGTLFVNPNYTDGTDGLGVNDAFLTVTRFIEQRANDSDPEVAVNIEGGRIYRLTNLIFTDEDLGTTPEKNEKRDVYVEVIVMPWTVVPVEGKFD